jgi:CheY-like chemotaxis protein
LNLKVLALGSQPTTRWITDSLFVKGDDTECYTYFPGGSAEIKNAKYSLAVVESYLADLEAICFKLVWYYRIRTVIVTSEPEKDWTPFKLLGVDAVIPRSSGNTELAADLTAVAAKGTPLFPQLKILVVEDDASIREAIGICLRMFWPELQVNMAKDGTSGLEFTRNEQPEVIFLDLGLPDISGFEVMTRIRAFSQVPIIVLTATAEKEYIVKAIEQGANDYIIKPFRQSDLMTRLKRQVLPLMDKRKVSAFRFFF